MAVVELAAAGSVECLKSLKYVLVPIAARFRQAS